MALLPRRGRPLTIQAWRDEQAAKAAAAKELSASIAELLRKEFPLRRPSVWRRFVNFLIV